MATTIIATQPPAQCRAGGGAGDIMPGGSGNGGEGGGDGDVGGEGGGGGEGALQRLEIHGMNE